MEVRKGVPITGTFSCYRLLVLSRDLLPKKHVDVLSDRYQTSIKTDIMKIIKPVFRRYWESDEFVEIINSSTSTQIVNSGLVVYALRLLHSRKSL